MNQRSIQVVTTAAWLLAACAPARADVHVKIRQQVVVSGTIVRLGDLADVVTADREVGQRLADVRLMPAPAPGTRRFVERREIEDLLTAHGVDIRELRIEGATKTSISTGTSLTPHTLSPAAAETPAPMNRHAAVLAGKPHDQVAPMSASRAGELHAEVDRVVSAYLNEKGGDIGHWEATSEVEDRYFALLDAATTPFVCQGPVLPAVGRQRFSISFNSAKGAIRVPVYAEVSVRTAPVVVTIRPIARGAVFTAADLEMRSLDTPVLSKNRHQALRDFEPIIGMEASQAIQAGEAVYADCVKPPCLVKRGEVVSLVSQAGGIRVRTTARAKQDGAHGELIQLETLDKREQLDARVTGPREATVFALTRQQKPKSPAWIETARRSATR